MTETYPPEYEQLLHQIHSEVFLERLRDYIDPDGDVPENDESDLSDLVRRQFLEDAPASIDLKDIEKLLENEEIRDQLNQSIRPLIKSQSEEET